MSEKITGNLGDNADTAAVGSGINQNRAEQRNAPSQNAYFGGGDNQNINQLWLRFFEFGQLLREQTVLNASTERRVTKLEGIEVEIRENSIFIRNPTLPPVASNIPMQTWLIAGLVLAAMIFVFAAYLIYLSAQRGGQ